MTGDPFFQRVPFSGIGWGIPLRRSESPRRSGSLCDSKAGMRRRAYADIDFLSECDQKAHQAVDGKIGEPSALQRAHFWLIDTKQLGRLNLGKLSLFDDLVDMADQLRLRHHFVGIGEAEVGKDIPAPGGTLSDSWHFGSFDIRDILPWLLSDACESHPTLASAWRCRFWPSSRSNAIRKPTTPA